MHDTGRGKPLLCGLGVAAVTMAVGYIWALVLGHQNPLILAAWFGAAGGFVGLFGYGSVVGIFVAIAGLLGCCRRSRGNENSANKQ